MSTIRVDNFAPSAGGTAFGTIGVAKTLCHWNSQSTHAIISSINVASITDNSVGNNTTAFVNAMADAVYLCCSGMHFEYAAGNYVTNVGVHSPANGGTKSTTAIRTQCSASNATSLLENDGQGLALLGDLA